MRLNKYTEIRKEQTKIPRLFKKEIPMCKLLTSFPCLDLEQIEN